MFARLSNLFRGCIHGVVSDAERANPEALLGLEREELRVQIGKYNQGLASHAAQADRLMRQVERQEREESRLRERITTHLRAGDRAAAGEVAIRRQQLQLELDENRRQIEDANTTFQQLIRVRDQSIAAAREKIEAVQRGMSEVKSHKAAAELNEMAAALTTDIGGAGDTLSRLEEMVSDGRDRAAGRARAAQDALDIDDPPEPEIDETELADRALADFAAQAGIVLEPSETDAAEEPDADPEDDGSVKTMGPAVEGP